MFRLSEYIYNKSPVLMQNFLISLYGLNLYRKRYVGGFFKRVSEEIEREAFISKKLIEEGQLEKLRKLIKHSYENVPFYKDEFDKRKINCHDIKKIDDIRILPIVSKEMIQKEPERFIAKNYDKKALNIINTSGTQGKPLQIYCDNNALKANYAYFERLKGWAGVQGRKKNITFAGRILIPENQKEPPFWRHNLIMNNLLFSTYHISEKNIPYYVEKIIEFKPVFIDSYPSAIYLIASYLSKNNITSIRPKAVITSSETLLEHQRECIERAFACKVFDQYGSAEMVANITQCERGSYHINQDYGIIEILNESEENVIDEAGIMVCTGFINYAMPLIRYKIGDTAIMSSKACSCNINFPIIKSIEGRIDDLIVTPEGNKIGRLDPIFKGLKTIKEAQIVQEQFDTIVLNLVKGYKFKEKEVDELIKNLKKRVGKKIKISVSYTDNIPRTKSGKFRSVISKVKQ